MAHARLRDVVAKALESSGSIHVVERSGDRDAVVRAARATRPDVIALGGGLLGAGGMTSLRELVRALAPVPVVVVGLEDNPAYAVAVRAAGASDYVLLDREAGELAGILRRAANR